MIRTVYVLITIIFMFTCFNTALAQQTSSQNKNVLEKYFAPQSVTKLEWNLLQFNIYWSGQFSNEFYLTSFPAAYDYKSNKFNVTFLVHERRDSSDKSFFSLPRPKREAIFNEAVTQLTIKLGALFPEIKTNLSLIYVQFLFASPIGSYSNVAVYKDGKLIVNE